VVPESGRHAHDEPDYERAEGEHDHHGRRQQRGEEDNQSHGHQGGDHQRHFEHRSLHAFAAAAGVTGGA
jgi:hypothetical protein